MSDDGNEATGPDDERRPTLPLTTITNWVKKHDANYAALRRAARTAIVMPSLFALSIYAINNLNVAIYCAFGSIALLMFVDFSGPMRNRLQAQAALSVIGAVFVCLGTLTSHVIWLSVLSMGIVTLVVIFAGVVSSVLASATTSLLLVFILSTAVPGPNSVMPDRLEGWGLASLVAFFAVWLLWPAKGQSAFRLAAATACRAVGAKLRADVSSRLGTKVYSDDEHHSIIEAAHVAIDALLRGFLAAPLRPTGLSVSSRAVVSLVDELLWMDAQIVDTDHGSEATPATTQACQIFSSSAAVLESGASLLVQPFSSSADLDGALVHLKTSLKDMESEATLSLPMVARSRLGPQQPDATTQTQRVEELVESLQPAFRAQELGFSASLIGDNINLAAAADRRGLLDTLSGRQPGATTSRRASARRRAVAHFERHSVWLHNSVRGAVGLSIAVFIAEKVGLRDSYWVILGTLSVLRSSAINTGQNALRSLLGTSVGFVVGAVVVMLVGTNVTLLWFLLPFALLIAGFAPTAISFAAGQAGFTLTLVILFNILQPADWHVGLYRVEDVAIGCAVSVVVGLLFWPRGAAAALGTALREAFTQSASYLEAAVNYATEGPDAGTQLMESLDREQTAAAAAALRLDDAFRTYLVERNSKSIPLAEVSSLVIGVANLRQSADAVLGLWQGDDRRPTRQHPSARKELLLEVGLLSSWYEQLGSAFVGDAAVPEAIAESAASNRRLVEAVGDDLCGDDTNCATTAVLLIWTRGYIESARRLQQTLMEPARVAVRKNVSSH
ncbi:MAG TPA: FUSC family protein [Acidimicrobiales bacterium]